MISKVYSAALSGIDKLDRTYFIFGFISVTALVGSFDVNINKVAAVFEFLKSAFSLALKVGIDITSSTLNLGYAHICAKTDTLEQVNS